MSTGAGRGDTDRRDTPVPAGPAGASPAPECAGAAPSSARPTPLSGAAMRPTPLSSAALRPTPLSRPAIRPTPVMLNATEILTEEVRDGDLARPMQLGTFFNQLGLAYELPERRDRRLARRLGKSLAKVRTRWWLPALAVLLAAVALVMRPSPPQFSSMPHEYQGEWRTESPEYRDRVFRIGESRFTIIPGARAEPQSYHIVGVSRDTLSDSALVTLDYMTVGGRVRFTFSYVERPRPTIYLANPQGVEWVRPSDSGYATDPVTFAVPPVARPKW